jgi:hypothetical protein
MDVASLFVSFDPLNAVLLLVMFWRLDRRLVQIELHPTFKGKFDAD